MSVKVIHVVLLLMLGFAGTAVAQSAEPTENGALAARVRDALQSSDQSMTKQIKVEAEGDAILLSGFVDSEADQERALELARSVPGVGSVRNDLVVRESDLVARESRPSAGQARDDTVIAATVRKEIKKQVDEGASDINVAVSDGVVQLSGYVADASTKNRAADVASTISGVQDVRNDIALKP
jgi:hyperosmotically inducible periplasmic protein